MGPSMTSEGHEVHLLPPEGPPIKQIQLSLPATRHLFFLPIKLQGILDKKSLKTFSVGTVEVCYWHLVGGFKDAAIHLTKDSLYNKELSGSKYQECQGCMHPIAALFTIAKIWKQPTFPSTEVWINKDVVLYKMEYYLAIKKNEIGSFVETWVNLETYI